MNKYGLLGEKLGHSYSPQIHGMLCDYEYKLYEVEKENVGKFLSETELSGMNVTIPYKKTVMEHCVWLSETAGKMGCVNTLVKEADGWHGYNTDYYGFCSLVKVNGIEVSGRKAVVLGSGGASNTVCRALEDLGASEVVVISRSGENNYNNLEKHKDAAIIVNATPVGMYPNNGKAAVDLKMFPRCEAVLDVVYNPSKTAIILQAEELNIKCASGLYMLVGQAKRSAELFTGKDIDDSEIERINHILDVRMENIILIGMPGSGKSSIGKALAGKLQRSFIDADEEIVKKAGKEIPEIFKEGGEEAFRKIETEVLSELGKLSGCIIATGGGCITRKENYPLLHQNGHIVWIKRALDVLPVDGRPISQSNPLEKLYAERKDKYEAFADIEVVNDRTIEEAAADVIKCLEESL
ncbi:MAG: shikimate kinase [Eubacteriales bacterium]|nr:shikimate kinase [Eubacteriales bacterium]